MEIINKEIIVSELKSLLETLQEQSAVLERGNEVTQFEFDLLFDNAKKFCEKLELLNRILLPHSAPPATSVSASGSGSHQHSPVTFRPEPRKSTPRRKSQERTPELFAEEEDIFITRLKEAREKSLGPRISESKPLHLKTLIGINEKFMFINELFSGNLSDYKTFIETVNEARTLTEAYDILDRSRRNNFWDPASEAFRTLKTIVENFISNK